MGEAVVEREARSLDRLGLAHGVFVVAHEARDLAADLVESIVSEALDMEAIEDDLLAKIPGRLLFCATADSGH